MLSLLATLQLLTSSPGLPTASRPSVTASGPSARPAGNAGSGERLYLRFGCYECHGTTGQGGGQFGPKIAPDPLPFIAYYRQLRQPRAAMPMYTHKVLSDDEVLDIYAYLQHVPPARSPMDIPQLNIR